MSDIPTKYDQFVEAGMAAYVDSDPYNLWPGWPSGFNIDWPWSNLPYTLAYSDSYVVVYSTLCTAAPILMLNLASLYLDAHETSILALSEVPFSILIGMLLVQEFPSLASWVGVALISVAGLLGSAKQR